MDDIRQVTEMASAGNWETIKRDRGVTMRSRWLSFGDSVKTREISSQFVVNADIERVIDYLVHPEKLLAWNDEVRSLKILKQEGSTCITHTVYDIPHPFSQQDLVSKNVLINNRDKTIIIMSALPSYIPPLRNVTRQQLYFGQWELRPLTNGTIQVHFSAISFSKSSIPRIIRDPIIQNRLFQSFVRLKELSSTDVRTGANQ
ncbi:MAG: hypothetical protein ACOCXV_02825 [Bacteroidota bacterium]